jgi:hypothetical protein
VTVGDGKTARFWTSSWIDGMTAKSLAPSLFQNAKRKKITVQKALQDNQWISHILPIQTAQEIREYVTLREKYMELHYKKIMMIPYDGVGQRMGST